jgi:DNA (cytosine-5)-methyltransferase 1
MEFGATYPFESTTPFALGTQRLARYRGSHGIELRHLRPSRRFEALPSHARVQEAVFPAWKVKFIRQNREYYRRNRRWIDPWIPKIIQFPSSYQKLEWNCKGEPRIIRKYMLQFRASGVRVKRANTAPSLVAMNTTQVPIVGWEQRYMTPRECSRLQSLDGLDKLPESLRSCYRALGNAVNVRIVEMIAGSLCIDLTTDLLRSNESLTRDAIARSVGLLSEAQPTL